MSEEIIYSSGRKVQSLTNRNAASNTPTNMSKYSLINPSKESELMNDLLPSSTVAAPSSQTSLELAESNNTDIQELVESGSETPNKIEESYWQEMKASKIRHWKEHEYAVGCVSVSWADELEFRKYYHKLKQAQSSEEECCWGCCPEEVEPACGFIYLTGLVCSRMKHVKRIGNMSILKESIEVVDEEVFEEESGITKTIKKEQKKIDLIVGPFWPMMLFITYPIIFSVSTWTFISAFIYGKKSLFMFLVWLCCTAGLITSLFQVAFRDPGILRRYHSIPKWANSGIHVSSKHPRHRTWKWSDAALTYRPYGALFDSDCACVIEEFDHTCPWTGTAIGKKNMRAFQFFVALVFICLIMDILLLTGVFEK